MALHPVLERVTARICERSTAPRTAYLERVDAARGSVSHRSTLDCANLAHVAAGAGPDQPRLKALRAPNLGIVSAYNDMLSAHQPMEHYPALIKAAARGQGCTAQFAGGVPAMCDGVTQGQVGMELSLFSRDTIALATAVALSHQAFDAALLIGVCDKIVPGLLMGALSFGHLPIILVPAGPMPSGLPHRAKQAARQAFAAGQGSWDELLAVESATFHTAGTCTFYGTANSNQMLMEVMGLHMPGTAFVNPGTPLRSALTVAAAERACAITALGNQYTPVGRTVDEKAIANGLVGLAATGGSTNHALHLVAIARAAGIVIDWDDLDEISRATPLLARIYPNGEADVNGFEAAGGLGLVIRELLAAGLLHNDIRCVHGGDLYQQACQPWLDDLTLRWREPPPATLDEQIVRPVAQPFDAEGGLRCLRGPLGRAIAKVSAVKPQFRRIRAPARVFESQAAVIDAFQRGLLVGDFVVVVRGQGPRANGMPELHKLTPILSVLQDRGQRVALLTDGRMSGASGKVLAVIHLTPEAAADGLIGRLRDGDMLLLDADLGVLQVEPDADVLIGRGPAALDFTASHTGMGRELFGVLRANAPSAECGASALFTPG